jgi:uncharacterized OB-fold protein
MNKTDIFEVELTDTYHYRLSYGGQSPFFRGLEEKRLVASKCTSCGFVWLPLRPICSRCYEPASEVTLTGEGEILTSIVLPAVPDHLRHLDAPVASALVRADGADTCMKVFVVSRSSGFAKGTRVKARYMPTVQTIADFYFTPDD